MSAGSVRRGPGRPRDRAAGQAILRATLELLAEEGFAGLTMDAVAARAGVAKTTVYRRWPSKDHLVLDAVRAMASEVPEPDTGSLRGDLVALLGQLAALLSGSAAGRAAAALIGAMIRDEQLGEAFRGSFVSDRLATMHRILERGIERGEIDPQADVSLLSELLVAPMHFRLLITRDPLDAGFVATVVDHVLASARPGRAHARAP